MDPQKLRKAYEFKIGKERTRQLSDEQITLLSKYYNSLSEKEQSVVDNALAQGKTNDLTDMADAFISENDQEPYEPSDIVKQYDAKFDEAVEEYNKKVEKFKAKEEKRIAGMFQYKKPVGPEPMQGPKEPPKQTYSPENDEDWESETNDQLGTKLDEVLEQIRNEPLPQPTKTKRRKTKGKKALQRKSARMDAKEMGVGASLTEIMTNVVETREALFDLYKVNKERFQFKKKIDKQLTAALSAKLRERAIEKGDSADDATGLKPVDEEGKKKKPGLLKKSLISGLVGGAIMTTMPLLIEGLRPFFERDRENEGENQWWDFLDVFPNEIKKDLDEEPALEPIPEEPTSIADQSGGLGTPDPEPMQQPAAEPMQQPAPAAKTPTVAPMPLRNTNIPGDPGYQRPQPMPLRAAAEGGKFVGGEHEPLRPISKPPVGNTKVRKLTKPLSSVISLPQKAAAAGVLSFANSIISPFAAFLPDSGKQFIKNIYRSVADSSGLSGMKLDMGEDQNVIEKIKKKLGDILNSLLGISPAAAGTLPPSTGPTPPPPVNDPVESQGQAGGAVEADELYKSMGFSKEDWDTYRNTVAQIESSGRYDIKGGSGDHYDGRYQLGAAAKTDGARYAGIQDPGHSAAAREAFRNDPALQEQLMAGFTKANHSYLMNNPEYANATPQRKLQILGYAHNQGMGGAENWMKTGQVGSDGFGTKGTKYTDALAEEFRKQKVAQPKVRSGMEQQPPEASPKRNLLQQMLPGLFPAPAPVVKPEMGPLSVPSGRRAPQQPGS